MEPTELKQEGRIAATDTLYLLFLYLRLLVSAKGMSYYCAHPPHGRSAWLSFAAVLDFTYFRLQRMEKKSYRPRP